MRVATMLPPSKPGYVNRNFKKDDKKSAFSSIQEDSERYAGKTRGTQMVTLGYAKRAGKCKISLFDDEEEKNRSKVKTKRKSRFL